VLFAVHDGEVLCRGVQDLEIEQGFFSGFPRMQSAMFVILCNTQLLVTVILRYVYVVCSKSIGP